MLIQYTTDGLTGFSPDDFPEAHDFTVELTICSEDQEAKSLDLAYVVSSLATRISWAWWNEPLSKIRAWTTADIPCGTVEKPYCDSDQGWDILLWQFAGDIFVAEGDGKQDQDTYTRWFKVSRDSYDAGWAAAIDRLPAS